MFEKQEKRAILQTIVRKTPKSGASAQRFSEKQEKIDKIYINYLKSKAKKHYFSIANYYLILYNFL